VSGRFRRARAAEPDRVARQTATDTGRDEYLVFGSPLLEQAEIDEVVHSLRSGWVGSGPKVALFQSMLEKYLTVPYVRCLSSCTAGLFLALHCLGIGPGDEVLVPTMTFAASANAVEQTGATPVLVDSAGPDGLIDLAAAESAITDKTRAIMPVHLAGRPVDLDRLNALRDRCGLAVVEDAAHAIGARWRDQPIGSFGNVTAFSFYVTKNITSVEGGALATDDARIAGRAERLALHGLSVGAWQRFSDAGFKHYEVHEPGFKFNMTDVHAAVGIHQLPRLDRWIDRRAELWERYDHLLSEMPIQTPPPASPNTRHARHLYQVQLEPDILARLSRDDVVQGLHERNIGAGVHYRAVHLHPYYRDRYRLDPGAFPVATDISQRTLSLPLSPKVTERDQDDVAAALAGSLGL
jgi:dTDP-4-amino-4,6-dideoxygalactose transaminase